MPHPKAEINPLWGIRLKEICDECDIRQADLAKRIFISQQTISKIINGKATLTLQTAQRIIDLYPQYRIEWLTGRDDYKTLDDLIGKRVHARHEAADLIERVMNLHGYTIRTEWVTPDISKMTKAQLTEYERNPYHEPRYSLWDGKGNGRYFQSKKEIDALLRDISRYVFLKCWDCLQVSHLDWMGFEFERSE